MQTPSFFNLIVVFKCIREQFYFFSFSISFPSYLALEDSPDTRTWPRLFEMMISHCSTSCLKKYCSQVLPPDFLDSILSSDVISHPPHPFFTVFNLHARKSQS